MKQKIETLTGKMCRIKYRINGYPHELYGIIEKSHEEKFLLFLVNGGKEIKIQFKNITDIEEIK